MRGIVGVSYGAAVVGAVILAGACTDRGVVAPRDAAPAGPAFATTLGISVGDTTVSTFVVLPGAMTAAVIGEHKIRIPAGAVCDPALSSYGPTEWDRPCQSLLAPLTITAKAWRNAAGHPVVDFQPALRFRPTDKGVATLYLMDKVASADASFQIFYCAQGKCIDESVADPSVATMRDASNGYAYRQLKHFSGYLISASRTEAETDASVIF